MTLAHSTAMKDYSLDSGWNSGPNAAAGGTLLGTLMLAAASFGASSAGVITAGAIGSDTSADATGTAAHFRIRKSGDTNGASSAVRRVEGTVGTSGTDMIIDNAAITIGGTIACSSLTVTHPA
jgi:hypothetical protein